MPGKIANPIWLYRIIHFNNLEYLNEGLYAHNHTHATPNYISIGNTGIIETRNSYKVKIDNYGCLGDYIPFYFGTQSIMLYNILTGYGGLKKQPPEDIIYLCCKLDDIQASCKRFFFADGQANKRFTEHFTDLKDLEKLDWETINNSDFKATETDPDKPRRYQAELLVHQHIPINCIGKIVVYNKKAKALTETWILKNNLKVPVEIAKKEEYYFYF